MEEGIREYVECLDLHDVASAHIVMVRDVIAEVMRLDEGTLVRVQLSVLDSSMYEVRISGMESLLSLTKLYHVFIDKAERSHHSVARVFFNPHERFLRMTLQFTERPRVRKIRRAPVLVAQPEVREIDGQRMVLKGVLSKESVDTSEVAVDDEADIYGLVVAVKYFYRDMPQISVLPIVNKEVYYRVDFEGCNKEFDLEDVWDRCLQPDRDARSTEYRRVIDAFMDTQKGRLVFRIARDQDTARLPGKRVRKIKSV